MQHPLAFADKVMDLFDTQSTILSKEDVCFLDELNIGDYIITPLTTQYLSKVSPSYFEQKELVIEDIAFLAKYLHETVDIESIARFVHFMAKNYVLKSTNQIESIVIESVVCRVKYLQRQAN